MSYTPNMQAMQEAAVLVSKMISLVKVYESGVIQISEGLSIDLSPQNIIDLKQEFAAARTACEALLDSVSD